MIHKQHNGHPVLSLCMIVRDAAHTLRPCLASIAPWVDEMIVVDTGSLDDTAAIAREFGARVSYFPWIDDFSAARNESLRLASGEWLFWMDADDSIVENCGSRLRNLVDGPHDPRILGYVCQVHCPAPRELDPDDRTVVDHVKLIRNHPQMRFEGRLHEQILPAIRRLNGEVAWTDIFVVHSGADHSAESRSRKLERDLRHLKLDLLDRPNHPFVLFNFGMTYDDVGQYEEAVTWLTRCLAVTSPQESHLRKAYALLANSLGKLNRVDEALDICQRGQQLFPRDPELFFRAGMLFHQQGQLEKSAAAYRCAILNTDDRHFTSIDPSITGYKARHNLALVYREMGRSDLAEIQCRIINHERPAYMPGRKMLAEALLQQRKLSTAQLYAEESICHSETKLEGLVLLAEIAAVSADYSGSMAIYEKALGDFPGNLDLLRYRAKTMFDLGALEEARQALEELSRLCPEDGSVLHNLALVYMRQGDIDRAITMLRQSLILRPKYPETTRLLNDLQNSMTRLPIRKIECDVPTSDEPTFRPGA